MAFRFTPPCCCCQDCVEYKQGKKPSEYQFIPPSSVEDGISRLLQQNGPSCQFGILTLWDKTEGTNRVDEPYGPYYRYIDNWVTYFDASTGRTQTDVNGQPILNQPGVSDQKTLAEALDEVNGEAFLTWGKCDATIGRHDSIMHVDKYPAQAWNIYNEILEYEGTEKDQYNRDWHIWRYTASAEYNNTGTVPAIAIMYDRYYIFSETSSSGIINTNGSFVGTWNWQQTTPVGWQQISTSGDYIAELHATAEADVVVKSTSPSQPSDYSINNYVRAALRTGFNPSAWYRRFGVNP